jgi:hypothetical protein
LCPCCLVFHPALRRPSKVVLKELRAAFHQLVRLSRTVNARGHFPTEQAALKFLYHALMSLDPTDRGCQR